MPRGGGNLIIEMKLLRFSNKGTVFKETDFPVQLELLVQVLFWGLKHRSQRV